LLFVKGNALKLKHAPTPFIWLTAIATVYEFIGTVQLEIASNYWFQFYIILEFVALYYFYSKLLRPQFTIFFKITLLLFVVAYIVSCFPAGYFIGSSITKTMTPLFVIAGSSLWIRKLFIEMTVPNLWKNADFYFIAGFLLYHTSTFFFFLLSDSFVNLNRNFYDYWLVNIIAALIFRILLSIGTWQMKSN